MRPTNMKLRRADMACLTTPGSTGVMTSSPILILGGDGNTGRHVARRLGARGVPPMGQASHDFSGDAPTSAAANLMRAGS
jgi:hypothetical protein